MCIRDSAWGSGCSPSLTKDLVMFTDNQETVNLLALDMKTGEVVANLPVIDELPEGSQVAVENYAIVYDNGAGTVSTCLLYTSHRIEIELIQRSLNSDA